MIFMKLFLDLPHKFLKCIYPRVPTVSLQSSKRRRDWGKEKSLSEYSSAGFSLQSTARTLQIATLAVGRLEKWEVFALHIAPLK